MYASFGGPLHNEDHDQFFFESSDAEDEYGALSKYNIELCIGADPEDPAEPWTMSVSFIKFHKTDHHDIPVCNQTLSHSGATSPPPSDAAFTTGQDIIVDGAYSAQ
jgi:hypothetical protein